jgi:isoquinoline 1-oxidoreductase beta subunit
MTRGFSVSERTVLHRHAVSFLLFATLLVNKVAMAQIQQEDPCRYRLPHYEERWSCVSGVSHAPDYLDRVKYLVLGEETYVSFGGEIRETYERFRNPNFGLQPQDLDGYLLQRYLFHSEVRVRKSVRVYVELLSALENRRAGGPRPVVDEDRLDFHQGFVDIDLDIGQNRHAVLRFGRQEMALGSDRLIAFREGTNVPFCFDGVRTVLNLASWDVNIFATKPVANRPQIFDDPPEAGNWFWGIYMTRPLHLGKRILNLDAYYLGLDRNLATFQQGTAHETRHTVGARVWNWSGPWNYDAETIFQFGSFGAGDIRAWRVAADLSYGFPFVRGEPRFGLTADLASGDKSSGRRLTFGQLAGAASHKQPVQNPPLKPQSEWNLLGKSQPKVDIPSKVDGSAVFGMDLQLPGMVYAAVKNCPVFGGKLESFDRSSVSRFPGLLDVVAVPGGVVTVAATYWQAKVALDALRIAWEEGAEAQLNTPAIAEQYRQAMAGQDWVLVREVGNPDAIQHSYANVRLAGTTEKVVGAPDALEPSFSKLHSAEFSSQFLAHAPMEPMNATASITEEGCEVWAPTQGQELAQLMVAQTLGLPKEKVRVHRTMLGGGFGRRLVADFVLQVVVVAKAIGKPVKLIWSREEDMQHDLYRPLVLHRITVGLDEEHKIGAAAHQLVSPSILHYVYPQEVKDDYDPSCLEGLHGTRYRVPNVRVDFHLLKVGVPASTSVLRTTGYGPNIFATESFVDELADISKKDPYEFRRNLLAGDARALAVLDLAAEKSGWKNRAKEGAFRGIAFTEAFNTIICQVVELSVDGNAVKIHKVASVVDCGTVLNPNIAANNIEGGVAWGLSAAFKSEITFERGRVVQSNWHDFQVLRLFEMPSVEVYFVDSGARPLGGTGEVGPVTVIPAVANALFAATGKRYRSLPLSRHGLVLSPS